VTRLVDKVAILYDSQADLHGGARIVILAAHGVSVRGLDGWLSDRLILARNHPELLQELVVAECLAGLSDLNREAGAEYTARSGRPAGGGTLRKGS
jgi:hypothetical protein